jgi:hypothetical protein
MEPNDEYLCIVAERGSGPRKLYLPFEEDSRLSVTRQISRQIARHG